jgi:hypothetical protein
MPLVNSNSFILRELPPQKLELIKIVSNSIGDTDNFIDPGVEIGHSGYGVKHGNIAFDTAVGNQFNRRMPDQRQGVLQGLVVEDMDYVKILTLENCLDYLPAGGIGTTGQSQPGQLYTGID